MADITITEGDTLEVDYNLENTGDGTGTFDPRLLVDGVQEDQDTGIALNPAQAATGTLQWPTESGDAVTDALAEAVTDDTSDSITVTVEGAIPDSEIYLHDDFGDNKLQNRDESGTTTTNDLTGTYRPEYTIAAGSPTATNQELSLSSADALHTKALPDVRGQNVRWDIDLTDSGSNAFARISIWGTTTDHNNNTASDIYAESYFLDIQEEFDVFRLRRQAGTSGGQTDVINADQPISTPLTASVTHDGSGNWELFLDGSSQGSASDTTYTSTEPILLGVGDVRNPTTIAEYKVHP
jgi:hypothetical protein